MRWTDLPADSEPADSEPVDAGTLSRGEWEDLRRRLERLPAGHPSRPDGEAEAAAGRDGGVADPSGHAAPDPGGGQRAVPDAGRERQAGKAGRGGSGGPGELAGPDRHEPYRPWFTAGEPAEPWFTADPD
jgi:hypothetical protein